MKTKIYYLTRSYSPYQKGGGSLMRTGAVKYIQELGWNVTVIMPNYNSKVWNIDGNIIQIPFNYNLRIASYLERVGFYEDYLDKWVEEAFKYLKDNVKNEDTIFTTSGGELGMIKLGFLLQKEIGCKFIINFRDPLDYSLVNGLKLDNKFHVSREKQELKYLKNSNLIITSSKTNQKSLIDKYPQFKDKIVNNYFGYIQQVILNPKKKKTDLSIAYVGNMGTLQTPEILYDAYKRLENRENIKIYFIGDSKNYTPLKDIIDKNIVFIDYLPHEEFLKFMNDNIDVGFVSLTSDYLGACVPSKIYEYLNLGLPMIGALPDGDGMEIINSDGYGVACKYSDINSISNAIDKFRSNSFLSSIRENILKDRDSWSMKEKIKEVDKWLREVVDEN